MPETFSTNNGNPCTPQSVSAFFIFWKHFRKVGPHIAEKADKAIADFAGVAYISRAGLRALLSVHKFMAKKARLVFREIPPEVMEVFAMTGFNRILVIR